MRKQFVVIGLGRFGTSVAKALTSLGHDVLAIDKNESVVQALANDVTHVVQADARDEDTLRSLGIRNFDVVIVAVGADVEANIFITILLKEMGVNCVISKAQNALHGKVLERIGADKVVYPERDMGLRLAHNLVSTNVMDFIELSPDYSIAEILAPARFVNKSLGELDLRAKYEINVMAIKKDDTIIVAPGANQVLEKGDILVIVSSTDALAKLND